MLIRRNGGFNERELVLILRVLHQSSIYELRISTTGASEYKLNDKAVTYAAYNSTLISHNILVKAKSFLVFQGTVEAVASQSPQELSRLIEQISGSLELAPEYEKAKEAQERATENATFNFTKRRGIAGEIKNRNLRLTDLMYYVRNGQVQKYRQRFLFANSVLGQLILERILTKLYHIDMGIEDNSRTIVKKDKDLAGLR